MRKYKFFSIVIIVLLLSGVAGVGPWLIDRLVTPSVKAEMVGKDGVRVVSGTGEVVNLYAPLVADAPAGSGRLQVSYPGGAYGLRPESLSAGLSAPVLS